MQPSDFCVPVYLNQSVVFDLLAIIEDGLAQVSTIKTSENTKNKGEAGIGVSNVFALLGVTLKGERSGESNREVTHERVHTPVSLFAKVRSKLRADRMVQDLSAKATDLTDLHPRSFVELEVTLTNEFRFGVDWSILASGGRFSISSIQNGAGTVSPQFPGLAVTFLDKIHGWAVG